MICLFSLAILFRVFTIQFIEGPAWREKAKELTTIFKSIDASRGNIYTADGSLLATSVPIYEIRMDAAVEAITDKMFNEKVDSLAYCLSGLFKDKSRNQYKKELILARKNREHYHLIKRKVRYSELKALRNFPLFRLGKYKGGLIFNQQDRREMPFKELAARTIGYERSGIKPVGLEGAYNNYLKGISGRRLLQKIAGNVWIPLNHENEADPLDGSDLITTIDINFQDVAQHALNAQLIKHNADHGCVVVMDVKTGAIKAIANLTKIDSGLYTEKYNYAIGQSTEPGSTFKLVSLMAAMEDGLIDINDTVDTEGGQIKYYDRTMKDSHNGGYGKVTVQQAFEISTNVGISKIIKRCYEKNPQKFVDRIYKMNINTPLNIDLAGEGAPKIKNPKDRDWYGTTLPWMSIGYEVQLTPLHILTFYNAVANNGKMMKPYFVKEIKKVGKTQKLIEPVVINEAICSKETIRKAKIMLEGVVEVGTAINLKSPNYKIAGKTGTAQIAKGSDGYKGNKGGQKTTYQASFAGYFPADDPKYSCIVVITNPSNKVYYASLVAGPVFKEVADRIYASCHDIRSANDNAGSEFTQLPPIKPGMSHELEVVLKSLDINSTKKPTTPVSNALASGLKITPVPIQVNEKTVPDVTGMGALNAMYILENSGLSVNIKGKGAVKKQSILPGSPVHRGEIIILELL